MKSKSEILQESLSAHGLSANMALTRKAVYDAMEKYAEQSCEDLNTQLKAIDFIIHSIINSQNTEELIDIRNTLRQKIQ